MQFPQERSRHGSERTTSGLLKPNAVASRPTGRAVVDRLSYLPTSAQSLRSPRAHHVPGRGSAGWAKSINPLLRHEVEGVHRLGSRGYQTGLFGASADDQRTGYVHNPVPTDEVAAECHRCQNPVHLRSRAGPRQNTSESAPFSAPNQLRTIRGFILINFSLR